MTTTAAALRKLMAYGRFMFHLNRHLDPPQRVEQASTAPYVRHGLKLQTSGSSGRSVRISKDLDFLAVRVPYDHMIFRMLGISDVPLALWYPRPPAGAGLDNAARYAMGGRPADRWFDMIEPGAGTSGLAPRLMAAAVACISQSGPNRIPYPGPVPLRDASAVLDWLLQQRDEHGRAAGRRCSCATSARRWAASAWVAWPPGRRGTAISCTI